MSDDLLKMVQGRMTPLSKTMGMVFTKVEPDLIEAEMLVRPDLCTTPAILHGGAMMALADNVGAVGTVVNLSPGTTTTTIESKTNFLAAVPEGQKAIATAIPLHRGKTTMVWQTTIRREDGRTAAIVTQTQLVLQAK
ncbi:MAG: phenylacetic acid degradation protein [Minwuia thermotolerans]|nr:MAG: phenylacetic acid degradation protein [Minwuia thermotolerans]